jgi:hypothetical protein
MQADLEAAAEYLLAEIGFESDLQLFSPLRQGRFQTLDDTVQVSGLRRITQSDAAVDAESAQVDAARQRPQQPQPRLYGDPSQRPRFGPPSSPGCPVRTPLSCRFRAPLSLLFANRFLPAPGSTSVPQGKGEASQGAPGKSRTPSPGVRTSEGDPHEPGEQRCLGTYRHGTPGQRPVYPHAQRDREGNQGQRRARQEQGNFEHCESCDRCCSGRFGET